MRIRASRLRLSQRCLIEIVQDAVVFAADIDVADSTVGRANDEGMQDIIT
jgi:hypothetical protein